MRVPIPDRLQWHRPTLFGWFQCSLIAYVLWSLFYFQFLVSFASGESFFGSFSAVGLNPYIKVEGYPWTLAELFLGVSLVAGVVSMASAIVVTAKARAKWRLRLMVLLFAAFPIGFAWFQYSLKTMHIDGAEWRLERLEEDLKKWPEESEWYEREIEDLRVMLKQVER